ncbi:MULTISPECIES: ABC transporter ATP-binding protein [Roseobacteraceae]|uniref:ABC transporter ATP-binding protein n=1 Tax=Roseobacteraceae TaxID=2854170 RepID=UPI00125FB2BA|nr:MULTISPECIES: ABC transporter ATP-binding protein [Roseobacteraceae]KAB6717420.1 ABC transporter ATP-binding protein [Roseobacter sp. TSBP12]|tara:strand:- start:168 stop:1013 length:846 start_codon:yes stop_codon:yes gene_type:complete
MNQMTHPTRPALFSIRDLRLSFADRAHKPLFGPAPRVEVLKGLSLDIPEGRITGIVGESGSGKSTFGRILVRLLAPESGQVLFDGKDIGALDEAALRPLRRDLQMIFQDPMSSLNPRHRVWRIIAQPMKRYGRGGDRAAAITALGKVGLSAQFADRYPHELSGGQRQRVGIARAIALEPRFILADEIVSGLDVSSQAQVLSLLADLARDMGLTLAFISHDLSVIRHLCDTVVVLHHGEIVDQGPVEDVFEHPQSAITKSLLSAIPRPEMDESWWDDMSEPA